MLVQDLHIFLLHEKCSFFSQTLSDSTKHRMWKQIKYHKEKLIEYMYPKWITLLLGAKIRSLLLFESCKIIYFVEIWKTAMTLWGLMPYFAVSEYNLRTHLIHKNSIDATPRKL